MKSLKRKESDSRFKVSELLSFYKIMVILVRFQREARLYIL